MSIVLSTEFDPVCRAIAVFLAEQLSQLDAAAIEVETCLDYDGMIGGAGVDFPLLQVYRLTSEGAYLERTKINIDYYLYSTEALAQQPGTLRLVEVAIAHLLQDKLPFYSSNYADLGTDQIRVKVERSQRGFLKLEGDGGIFPYVRITAELQEIDVQSPIS